ncbi:hypothetical protein GETHLI_04610 [Geothrix limicola]|uniref:Uncharacterized protein n=1 Tax=Geothrix limicola TaxID=2927978 RepID=A0ABQ5QBN6_9BACT|nr:hypothetical protein [Geothrix limicola]GLH71959.1 hypothetical protein GETHLI_04610 [Geothrix limicola]
MTTESASVQLDARHRLYTVASWGVVFIVLLGFAKTYYLKLAFGTPALPPLLHLHGLVMTLWFALFLVQTRLVAARRVDLHKKLGLLGAFLAASVLVVGTVTAITAARLGHTPGPPALIFLVVPLGDMVVFGTLVGTGLAMRRNREAHRRLLLLSCVGILAAAIARIPLDVVAKAGPVAYFGLTDLAVIGCALYDRSRHGRFHPAFLWGGGFVILSHWLRLALAGTGLWMQIATWLTR